MIITCIDQWLRPPLVCQSTLGLLRILAPARGLGHTATAVLSPLATFRRWTNPPRLSTQSVVFATTQPSFPALTFRLSPRCSYGSARVAQPSAAPLHWPVATSTSRIMDSGTANGSPAGGVKTATAPVGAAPRSRRGKKTAAPGATPASASPPSGAVEASPDDNDPTGKPPAAKRARRETAATAKPKLKDTRGGEGDDEAVPEAAAQEAAEGAAPAPGAKTTKAAKPRKPRAKVGAAEPADAGTAEQPAAAPAPAAAKAPKGGRSKKAAPTEPLPVYTSAMRKPPPGADRPSLKILSWNVAGLRALLKKQPGALSELVAREELEAVCLQEHKLQKEHTAEVEAALGLKGWSHYWSCSSAKLGYSGVSIHTRTPPLSVTVGLSDPAAAAATSPDPADPDEHGLEGRVVTVELPAAFLVCVYVPNSGEGLKRLAYRVGSWDGAFAKYIQGLQEKGKPVIVTGDLNCAHKEIDIHAPKTNLRSAGFTVEERESFGRLLLGEVGLVDSFRRLHPNTVAYTYFTRRFNCREQNKGWRLDYFLTSGTLMPEAAAAGAGEAPPEAVAAAAPAAAACGPPTPWRVYDSWIMQDVYGSDHLPLGLTLVHHDEPGAA